MRIDICSHTQHTPCNRLLSGYQFRPRISVIVRAIIQEHEYNRKLSTVRQEISSFLGHDASFLFIFLISYNCPASDRYTRSKVSARQSTIARSVLCVAENVDKHYGHHTSGVGLCKDCEIFHEGFVLKSFQ